MPGDPRLRTSDADRERTVELLREHHAVGRITAEEYDDRLNKVFAAKTLGELDGLLADLPAIDLYQLPSAGIGRGGARIERRGGDENLPERILPWAGVTVAGLAAFGAALAMGAIFNSWIPTVVIIVVIVCIAVARRRPH